MRFLQKVTHASKRSLYRFVVATLSVLLVTGTFLVTQQHAAAIRLTDRSLFIHSAVASKVTTYTISFTFRSVHPIGSIQMLFCTEAIPYLACDPPSGLDLSAAALSIQTGETGFTLSSQTANSLILSRPAVANASNQAVSYEFTNVVNPNSPQVFYARLNSYATTDATGSFWDFGSVASVITNQIGLVTQVPPYLVFCTGKEIPGDCTDPVGPAFEDFEEPDIQETMSTSSQMLAYTNARNGYVVVMSGRSLTSGIYEIPAISDDPEVSLPGKGQFGVNMAENTDPDVGDDPVGPGTTAVVNSDYTNPNQFMFKDGDTIVTSPGVTKRRKFTVSYVINVPPDQHPGIYSTTITYICTGNF